MDCRQYQDALNAAAIGAESGPDARAFHLHLEICEACRSELARRREFLGVLDRQLQTHFEAAPSCDFNSRLRRRIAEEQNARPAIFNWLPLLAGAAAIAALLTVIYTQHRSASHHSDLAPNIATARPDATHELAASPEQGGENAQASPAPPLLHPVIAARPPRTPVIVRIDHQEVHAVVQFAHDAEHNRVDSAALIRAQQTPDEPLEPAPLKTRPIDQQLIETPELEGSPAQ